MPTRRPRRCGRPTPGRPAWSHQMPLVIARRRRDRPSSDTVTGRSSTARMRYHDGVYDGPNREFRGFTYITLETGDSDGVDPPVRQEVEFFQGDPDEPDLVERARQRALAGATTSTALYERVDGGRQLRQRSDQVWEVRAEHDDGPARSVWFPHVVTIETREAATAGPDRVETLTHLGFDAHGNPTGRRRRSFADGDPAVPEVVSEERTTYLDDETRWLVRLPVRVVALDTDGVPFSVRVNRYGGPAFTGLLEGSATTGLVTVVSRGPAARRPDPGRVPDRGGPGRARLRPRRGRGGRLVRDDDQRPARPRGQRRRATRPAGGVDAARLRRGRRLPDLRHRPRWRGHGLRVRAPVGRAAGHPVLRRAARSGRVRPPRPASSPCTSWTTPGPSG